INIVFRCENWKRALGFVGTHKYANLTPDQCNSRIKICELHFPPESFMKHKLKIHLQYNAVPSLYLNGEAENQKDASFQKENGKFVFLKYTADKI
ncbi:unnamed protein product, partial [Callosobruchus maculatus]